MLCLFCYIFISSLKLGKIVNQKLQIKLRQRTGAPPAVFFFYQQNVSFFFFASAGQWAMFPRQVIGQKYFYKSTLWKYCYPDPL